MTAFKGYNAAVRHGQRMMMLDFTAEEGITAGCWVTPDEWHRRLSHSYGTLKTLANQWKHSRK